MWIGSQKGNKDKVMGFNCITEPIKALGAFLSYDEDKNEEENVFIKIRKMKTKLNIWQTRDLSLYAGSFNAGEDSTCFSIDIRSINVTCPCL